MQPHDLSDELLTLIHNGAAPLDRRDHRAYCNHITVWLDESPLLTPRALADVIKEVQGKLLLAPRCSVVLGPGCEPRASLARPRACGKVRRGKASIERVSCRQAVQPCPVVCDAIPSCLPYRELDSNWTVRRPR
jgi:hypothetical protein